MRKPKHPLATSENSMLLFLNTLSEEARRDVIVDIALDLFSQREPDGDDLFWDQEGDMNDPNIGFLVARRLIDNLPGFEDFVRRNHAVRVQNLDTYTLGIETDGTDVACCGYPDDPADEAGADDGADTVRE